MAIPGKVFITGQWSGVMPLTTFSRLQSLRRRIKEQQYSTGETLRTFTGKTSLTSLRMRFTPLILSFKFYTSRTIDTLSYKEQMFD